jgi:hypothetical protein
MDKDIFDHRVKVMHDIFDKYSNVVIAQMSQNLYCDVGTLEKVEDSFFDELKRCGPKESERNAKIEEMKIQVKARGGIKKVDKDAPITKAKGVFINYLHIKYPLVYKKIQDSILSRGESNSKYTICTKDTDGFDCSSLNILKFLFDAVMIKGLADEVGKDEN